MGEVDVSLLLKIIAALVLAILLSRGLFLLSLFPVTAPGREQFWRFVMELEFPARHYTVLCLLGLWNELLLWWMESFSPSMKFRLMFIHSTLDCSVATWTTVIRRTGLDGFLNRRMSEPHFSCIGFGDYVVCGVRF